MTPKKVIEIVDRVKVNAYTDEDKFSWLNELDGLIQRTVMQTEPVKMNFPQDMSKELLAPFPHDSIYPLWVEAMIDYRNKEFANYNNAVLMFNEKFEDYKKAYIRGNMPASKNFKNVL